MEEITIKMSIETILSIAIPLTGAAFFIARYFWKKEKCFALMKAKIDELSKSDSGSNNIHEEYGNRLTALESQLDLLLTHFNLK